jgi:WD40 repeat protein/serine/threonine protein kinase
MLNTPAQSIGNYKVLEIIQALPEWTLCKALEQNSAKAVLIKIYLPKLEWSDELLNEFFDRVGYLKFIEHENLLAIEDFGKYQQVPYIVYPYHSFCFDTQNQPSLFNETEFLERFYKIADALDYLHRQEIFHGLLSPESVLVDAEGVPKVFDYGVQEILKKVIIENVDVNLEFLALGNVKFSAPELLSGSMPTRQSDIYAYGLMFYWGIFGKLPFQGRSVPETALFHYGNDLSWLLLVKRNLSKKALTLLTKSVAHKPSARFESFEELINLIGQIRKSKNRSRLINGAPPVRPAYTPGNVSDLQTRPPDPSIPEEDLDRTFDYIGVTQAPAKPAVQQKTFRNFGYIYAVLGIAGLAGLGLFYYFFSSRSSQPGATTSPSVTPLSAIFEPTASATPAPVLPTSLPAATPTSLSIDISLSPTSQVLQATQVFKPAIEGEQAKLPIEPISLANLGNLGEFSRLGYGRPDDVDVSDDATHFVVGTSAGVFIYENDVFLKWIDPGGWASSVQFSPDGDSLAIGLASGEIQVWDWRKEEITARLTANGHTKKVIKVLFSKNGRHLFSASNDQYVIMWDIKTQSQIRKILTHAVPVEDFAVSEDERTLVTGAGDQFVRIWDLAATDNKPVWEIPFQGNVLAVAISAEAEFVAAAGDGGILRQWSLVLRQPRTDPIPIGERIWGIKYIDNDQTLFVALANGATKLYSASQKSYIGVSTDFVIPPVDMALIKSMESDFRETSASDTYRNGSDNVSILWNGRVINHGKDLTAPIFDNLDRLVFSQDGKIVAARGRRGITSVWNAQQNQVLFKGSADLPVGQPIAPDNSAIAVIVPSIIHSSTVAGETVKINIYRWIDLNNPGIKRDLSEVIQAGTVSYSKDGKIFVSAILEKSKVWDYESGYETFYVSNAFAGCQITKSINDGTIYQVASAAGTFFELNEQTTNLCKTSFAQKQYLLGLSANLNLLAYTKGNGWLEAYDPAPEKTNKVLWTNNNHKGITALAVSPDGSLIAVGDAGGFLILIDAKTGNDLRAVRGNYGILQAITFSNDGKVIGTAGSDGAVRLFGIFAK